MKKNSKVIRKDYKKLEDKLGWNFKLYKEYYGLFIKNGRVRIDSKRLLKVLPHDFKNCDFTRNTVYYQPLYQHKYDYMMNYFLNDINEAKTIWEEQKKFTQDYIDNYIEKLKKLPAPNYNDQYYCGIIDRDEMDISNMMGMLLHQNKINQEATIKAYDATINLYLSTIHSIATRLEHAMVVTLKKNGYSAERCGRSDIFKFMDGKIKDSEKKIRQLAHFDVYDKFYSVWNFTKHNSLSTYNKIKKHWQELLYDKGKKYKFPSESLAISYLNINNTFFDNILVDLIEFYYEFCELCYKEPKYHSVWDYDNYFLEIINKKIKDTKKDMYNPFGLSTYI